MSPKLDDLTDEQRATIRELQAELRALDDQADAEWAKYVKTGDLDCFNQVLALEGEIEMKWLVAYVPTKGEKRVGRIKALIERVRGDGAEPPVGKLMKKVGYAEYDYQARVDALDSVNAWREAIGLPVLDKLPAGVVGDSANCTLALALRTGLDAQVSVSGGDDMTLSWYDDETGRHREVIYDAMHGLRENDEPMDLTDDQRQRIINGEGARRTVITMFDEWDYVDLIADDDALLSHAVGSIEENGMGAPQTIMAFEEIKRRGLIERFVNAHVGIRYEEGDFYLEPRPVEDDWS